MLPLYNSRMRSLFKLNNLTRHFPSLIQAKYGRSGKWVRNPAFVSSKSGSGGQNLGRSNGRSSTGGMSGFDDGFDGSKPRASSELLFFSTGKSFASYPLDTQSLKSKPGPAEALKTMIKPADVKIHIQINHLLI